MMFRLSDVTDRFLQRDNDMMMNQLNPPAPLHLYHVCAVIIHTASSKQERQIIAVYFMHDWKAWLGARREEKKRGKKNVQVVIKTAFVRFNSRLS